MKVRKTNPIDDLKFKEEEFLKLTPLERLAINQKMKERMFGKSDGNWEGTKVRRVYK